MTESKVVFVTGSEGAVGRRLLPELLQNGFQIETNMRYYERHAWHTVVHLAGSKNTSPDFDPNIIYDNILLTEKIFSNSSRIIAASSCIAGYSNSLYAYSKQWTEHLAIKHGNALALRFHNIYGYGASGGIVKYLMDCYIRGKKTITVRGAELQRDYLYLDNAVQAIIENIKVTHIAVSDSSLGFTHYANSVKNIGILEIGTGIATSTIDLVSLFTELTGHEFEIEIDPPGDHEPKIMFSNNPLPNAVSLKEGLLKTLNNL